MMSKEKRRVPKLRFPGFTEDWEQREFSDIFAEVKSGLSRMLSNDDIGLPVVRANNINDGQLNLVDDIKYWYKNDPQGANTNNYLIEQGDILINFINSEAKMGTAAYVTRRPERDTIYTTNILRCKVNDEYNPYFIYSLTFLNSYKNYIASITKPAVNQASFTTVDFKKYSIKIPTVKEQNQIADLIETFNKLITLHQRKLDNLKLKKKALLQKLFPKNGERYPELRFPGFTDAWEQRKFSEIYERAGQKNDLTYGIDKIISVANMYFKKDVTVGSEEYLKTYNVFKLGDIAFEGHTNKEYRYGRFVENTIGDGIVSHIFDVFTPKINLDINFWKDLIKYEPIMGPILRRCTKASRMMSNLTTKEFLEEQILCPTLEEQKLIGEFIVSLDKNITLHQRKLDHLQLQKKALLQQMFV